jgi:DNA-binding response OmpR family regulator
MAKILIVDDSVDLVDMLSILLKMNDHEVVAANTKTAMNKVMITFQPDVILLDVLIRDGNGRDICKEIKESDNKVSIILMSANPKLIKDHQKCKADDVIEKPFDIKTVVEKVNRLI